MARRKASLAVSLILVLIAGTLGWSVEPDTSNLTGVEAFRRPTLLSRFDRDADGMFSPVERKELRAAFGGVDVPALPVEPGLYTHIQLPSHLDATILSDLDNTPLDNPLTDVGATLGRVLFYDRQLSANNTIACASCHHQRTGFSDSRPFSLGFQGGRTSRNSMGLVNLRYTHVNGSRPGFFWDERAPTLEDQVLMPIQDQVEMGMELGELPAKLERLPYYPPLFQSAFGSPDVTSDRIAKAVAQFLRAMVAFDSKFDRGAAAVGGDYARDFAGFTDEENLGKSLFINGIDRVGEIGCAHCHVPPTFGMPQSFNNGLDLHYRDQGLGARKQVPPNDPFTPSNDGKFKAPSLRNVARTAPYMHDGRFQTLDQVLEHYSGGVHPHPNLGLAVNESDSVRENGTSGFAFTAMQKSALIAFLQTLTDDRLLSDARFSDPFVRLDE